MTDESPSCMCVSVCVCPQRVEDAVIRRKKTDEITPDDKGEQCSYLHKDLGLSLTCYRLWAQFLSHHVIHCQLCVHKLVLTFIMYVYTCTCKVCYSVHAYNSM